MTRNAFIYPDLQCGLQLGVKVIVMSDPLALCFLLSIYSRLKCRCCHSAVGTVIYSSPPRLASARSLFLLSRANISW